MAGAIRRAKKPSRHIEGRLRAIRTSESTGLTSISFSQPARSAMSHILPGF
jgi:hypothetical protein